VEHRAYWAEYHSPGASNGLDAKDRPIVAHQQGSDCQQIVGLGVL
jgi:hypothetical protein